MGKVTMNSVLVTIKELFQYLTILVFELTGAVQLFVTCFLFENCIHMY